MPATEDKTKSKQYSKAFIFLDMYLIYNLKNGTILIDKEAICFYLFCLRRWGLLSLEYTYWF